MLYFHAVNITTCAKVCTNWGWLLLEIRTLCKFLNCFWMWCFSINRRHLIDNHLENVSFIHTQVSQAANIDGSLKWWQKTSAWLWVQFWPRSVVVEERGRDLTSSPSVVGWSSRGAYDVACLHVRQPFLQGGKMGSSTKLELIRQLSITPITLPNLEIRRWHNDSHPSCCGHGFGLMTCEEVGYQTFN